MPILIETDAEETEPIRRLDRDLLRAARDLGPDEVRYIVDGYYAIQDYRKASNNQIRSALRGGESAELLTWLAGQAETIEGQIKRAMQAWAEEQRVGRWALAVKGMGPVLSAGLLAHFDITKAETAGHFWSFAGLNPDMVWERGQKRPYNAKLKTICWLVGDSFVKQSNREGAYYGQAYRERKEIEVANNTGARFKATADSTLQSGRRLSPDQRTYYEKGELPPGRIDLRARRWAVKLFLAHLHHVMYEDHHGRPPPRPYVIEHMGHTHYKEPPGWPCP